MKNDSKTTTKKDERKPFNTNVERNSNNENEEENDEKEEYFINSIVYRKSNKIRLHLHVKYSMNFYLVHWY